MTIPDVVTYQNEVCHSVAAIHLSVLVILVAGWPNEASMGRLASSRVQVFDSIWYWWLHLFWIQASRVGSMMVPLTSLCSLIHRTTRVSILA